MTLQNMQTEFFEFLLSADEESDLITPAENIQLYRERIAKNLINALEKIYLPVKQLLGERQFKIAALNYIDHYPLRSNLQYYGEYFSEFLKEHQQVALHAWQQHIQQLNAYDLME